MVGFERAHPAWHLAGLLRHTAIADQEPGGGEDQAMHSALSFKGNIKHAANFCCEGSELRGAEQLSRSGTGEGNIDDRRDTAGTRRQDHNAVTQKDRFSNTVGYK
jgi:hypothetical protein